MQTINTAISPVKAKQTAFGIFAYLELYKQRRALARMDDSQLKDLGLSRNEAMEEAKRSIWDAPANWKRAPKASGLIFQSN